MRGSERFVSSCLLMPSTRTTAAAFSHQNTVDSENTCCFSFHNNINTNNYQQLIQHIMSKSPSLRRIQADIRELALDPCDRYHAAPLEHDMLEWCVLIV